MWFSINVVCDKIMKSIIFFSLSYEAKLSIFCLSNYNSVFGKFMFLFTITKAGIYYVIGDTLPVQIIVTGELFKKESLWLRNLTNRLESTKDAEELLKDYKKHKKNLLYESVMDIIVRANKEKFEEAKKMCKVLEELMKDELEAKRQRVKK